MNEKKIEMLKIGIKKQREVFNTLSSSARDFEKAESSEEKKMLNSQINSLKKNLLEGSEAISELLKKDAISPFRKTEAKNISWISRNENFTKIKKGLKLDALEKLTLKKIGKEKKGEKKIKEKKPSSYINLSNRIFSDYSKKLAEKKFFGHLERDLIKASLEFPARSYISVMLFSTSIAFFSGILIFIFFLFFNIGAELPIVTFTEEKILLRLLKTFWIIFAVPISTFLLIYFYPSMEKKSTEHKIEQELPFAAIHMSAISGSMIEPSNIFKIIISTKEYPYVEKEFKKILNGINVYGYDLVNALRKVAFNGPSRKLSDLLNGLATTITSGGNLPDFFEKRAQSLLFEHRLEREKKSRAAETFMDIYISVVIAAPMILMLLLIMMKVSGLGIQMSTGMLTFLIVVGVALINVVFLTFLHLRND